MWINIWLFPHIWLWFISIQVSFALNTNVYNIAPIEFVDNSNYIFYDSVDNIPSSLFSDTDNIFILNDGSLVAHAKKFNTMERSSGDKFSLFNNISDTWYHTHPFDAGKAKIGKAFPLTPKVKSSHGDGGSVAFTYEISYGRNLVFDIPHIIDLSRIGGLLGLGTKHFTSFKMAGVYTCSLAKGESGQIYSQPYIREFSGYRIRPIDPVTIGVLGIKFRTLKFGEWKINNESFSVVDTNRTPYISCVKF